MLRVIFLFLCLAVALILAFISLVLPQKTRFRFHIYITKILARIFHLKIRVTGHAEKKGPVLFVSNHISYADIMVLGASLPGKFVSKAEISRWPIMGQIASVTGTVFIDRKKSAAGKHLEQIEEALFRDKKNLIIFPEGTTNDGRHVLPFKSSLFKIAEQLPEGEKLTIQPVTINYTHINGLPVQNNERKKVAWVGDASFFPHFREFVNLGMVRILVTIHAPIHVAASQKIDRKELAQRTQKIVESALD